MEQVYKALKSKGFCCMTMVDCEGTGNYSDHEKQHISTKFPFADAYRVIKLEILVRKSELGQVVKIIRKTARTGYRGDGMIIISKVESVYKIKTDENSINAI